MERNIHFFDNAFQVTEMQQELTTANKELQQLRSATNDQKKEITRMQTSLESEKRETARLQTELKSQNETVVAKESEKVRLYSMACT